MFRSGTPTYAACEVDRAATMIGRPQLMSTGSSTSATPPACVHAEVEFVVDERGHPRTDRIRAVRYNSTEFLNEVKGVVSTLRYEPAMKDGQRVPQVVRFGLTRTTAVVRVPAGSGPPAMPSPRRPNC